MVWLDVFDLGHSMRDRFEQIAQKVVVDVEANAALLPLSAFQMQMDALLIRSQIKPTAAPERTHVELVRKINRDFGFIGDWCGRIILSLRFVCAIGEPNSVAPQTPQMTSFCELLRLLPMRTISYLYRLYEIDETVYRQARILVEPDDFARHGRHQLVIVGNHLVGRESESFKEIELGDVAFEKTIHAHGHLPSP
jgi:hypothetical protein